MVVNNHHIAALVERMQSAGRVGNDQQLDAERLHHPDRKSRPLGGIPLVTVKPPLHGDDRRPRQPAAKQPALVAHGSRLQKIRDLAIFNRGSKLDRFTDAP
jgi:hypothetical protein